MNTLRTRSNTRVRRSLLAAAVAMAFSSWVSATVVSQFDAKAVGDITRLTLESPVGMLVDAGLSGRGTILQLRLKGADREELVAYVAKMAEQTSLFRSARVVPGEGENLRVMLEFKRPVFIADETVLALPGKISRWEIVVGSGEQPVAKSVPPSLLQIDGLRRDGRLDIVLSGSTGLVAEANFQEASGSLIVDLPEVPLAQASSAAGRFYSESGLIKSVKAVSAGSGVSRLVFELAEPADLIDTRGLQSGDQGRVILSLTADSRVIDKQAGKLSALGFEVGDGVMQMRLMGVGGGRVSAYTIEEPPRLVVDFLGWKPEQVSEALARFGSKSAATLGEPRLDTTRLGSARAVFDLAASAPFRSAKLVRLPIEGSESTEDNLLISMLPGAAASETFVRRSPLDLRFRRELHDGRASEVVIRPPTLENAAKYAMAAMRPEPAREYALMGMLSQAMQADSRFQAAKAEFSAISETVPQAQAGYLPTASFDYTRSRIHQNITKASNPTFPTGATTYPNSTTVLTITQPLFKPQAWIKMDQAELAVKQAELNLLAVEQDLIMRVATGYLNLLAAGDGVELSRAEREATANQHDQAKSRLENGLGTLAQVHDTEARLTLTKAREIEAENRVDDARLALKEIVGETVVGVRGFKGDFDASVPFPAMVEPWVDASREQNLALQGRNLTVEIAKMEVTRQQAGYLPTVSLAGSVNRQSAGGSLYGDGQRSQNHELDLRVTLPLYEGGMTASLTREAEARKLKAEHEREQEARRTERLARSAFNGIVTSSKTLAALRLSVVAQESALETRLEGYNSGLYNAFAVLDAYRLYYAAQRDFLQARYDYLLNRLKLKQAVGTLGRNDLEDIAALLQSEH